jgi:hypothetical protein
MRTSSREPKQEPVATMTSMLDDKVEPKERVRKVGSRVLGAVPVQIPGYCSICRWVEQRKHLGILRVEDRLGPSSNDVLPDGDVLRDL